MNKQQFEDKVRLIISDQLGVDLCEVKMDSHLEDDLGADSLDTIELVMVLEEEFNTEITEEEAEKCGYHVDNICPYLAENLGYSFYKSDTSQKASQHAHEEFYMTDTSKRTSLPQSTPVPHTEAS